MDVPVGVCVGSETVTNTGCDIHGAVMHMTVVQKLGIWVKAIWCNLRRHCSDPANHFFSAASVLDGPFINQDDP
jgi:hypothetical protein